MQVDRAAVEFLADWLGALPAGAPYDDVRHLLREYEGCAPLKPGPARPGPAGRRNSPALRRGVPVRWNVWCRVATRR